MNEDRIRLKNALQSIAHDPSVESGVLKTVHSELLTLVDSTDFWLHQAASLAIFADQDGYQVVHLPHEIAPYVCVDERFVVSPLLSLASMSTPYYLLDINLEAPRLYAGTDAGLTDVGAGVLPGPMDEVLEIDERKKSLDFRSGDSAGNNMFYGHGSANEARTNDTDKYLRILADAVDTFLADKTDQLLLAGTASRIAELRPLLSYKGIASDGLHVNRDAVSDAELHQVSRRAALGVVAADRASAVEAYRSTNVERTVDGITGVIAAAEQGKVETLYLPVIRMTADGVTRTNDVDALVEMPEQMSEFETAVRAVMAQGGGVIAVEQRDFADDPSMKALLRF